MIYRLWMVLFSASFFLSAQTPLGDVSAVSRAGNMVILQTDSIRVQLRFYAKDIVRVDLLSKTDIAPEPSFVVVQEPPPIPYSFIDTDSVLAMATASLEVRLRKHPLRISFIDSLGRPLLAEPERSGYTVSGASRALNFVMPKDAHYYGTGERGTALDKRGQRFVSYNTQIGSYSDSLPTMNLNVPLVTTPNGYALFIDNTYRGIFDLGVTDPNIASYSAEGGELSYYVIAAPDIPAQLERYTWLTGRQPLPPRWIFGFTQSKNRYRNEEETRGIVRTMREKGFPCDAIVLDLAWFRNMGDISWDTAAWPNHRMMVRDFLSQGIKTLMITEPYIIQPSVNFAEADAKGYLAKDSSGKSHLIPGWWSCGGCNSSLLDLTHPDAMAWWWSKHPAAFGEDVAGIWTDLGEPENHPETMLHHQGSAVKVHNIFNLLWAKMVFEGFSAMRPNERVVNLTRSGFAGIQRYGVLPWSGDVARTFGGLAVQLPMLLNMGMSGIAYHNSDIGGYARNATTPELYIRWMQYGVFCPITRTHGAGESVRGYPTEPWMFGPEAEAVTRRFLRLRYALLPYNYSLAHRNYESGMPLARPLFWSDPTLTNESSSYLWGDAFLVSPVVAAGKREQEMTLPAGRWYNYWTDEQVQGGRKIIVSAPLDQLPLFVKGGSIIPMAPVMEYSDQRPLDTLYVHLYPDASVGSPEQYVLYEDDGTSLEYQQGKFSRTTMTHAVRKMNGRMELTMDISAAAGEYTGKLIRRNYLVVIHGVSGVPSTVTINSIRCRVQRTEQGLRANVNSFRYDTNAGTLTIHSASELKNGFTLTVSDIAMKRVKQGKE